MGEVVDAAAAANTSKEATGAGGGGVDPVWRGTAEGLIGAGGEIAGRPKLLSSRLMLAWI